MTQREVEPESLKAARKLVSEDDRFLAVLNTLSDIYAFEVVTRELTNRSVLNVSTRLYALDDKIDKNEARIDKHFEECKRALQTVRNVVIGLGVIVAILLLVVVLR